MRVVHVGLGGFGFGWLKTLMEKDSCVDVVAVVDANQNSHRRVGEIDGLNAPLFTDLGAALDALETDFVLNSTPPSVHKTVSLIAMERGIPVLCEKPIAANQEDAIALCKASDDLGVPLTIAENYRFNAGPRLVRQLIADGAVGPLHAVNIRFFRNHSVRETSYHTRLAHPLLLDVAVHHFDLLRFFTGSELEQLTCRAWTPAWSSYAGFSNADVLLEMNGGLKVSYVGSLASKARTVDWMGEWQIEGELGTLHYAKGNKIVVLKNGEEVLHKAEATNGRMALLTEFLNSLREKRPAETCIQNNFKSYAIAMCAIRASETGQPVTADSYSGITE